MNVLRFPAAFDRRFWGLQGLAWLSYAGALMLPWIGVYSLAVMVPNKLLIAASGMVLTGLLRQVYDAPPFREASATTRLGIVFVASLLAGVALQLVLSAAFGEMSLTAGSALAFREGGRWVPELGGAGYQSLLILSWSMAYLGLSAGATARRSGEPTPTTAARDSVAVFEGSVRLRDGARTVVLDPREIAWLGAEGDYVRVHGPVRRLLVRTTMGRVEETLGGHGFVRIHRSVVVNVRHVREVAALPNAECRVVLRSGERLKASRTYARRLRERLGMTASDDPSARA